ncbi:arginine repressor [Haloimpatiens sp. FM7315]|uniref:arginine repressor n=1 Tax=Haloimpatiens sp. FM7315 TaxID=3298609 RepID=UPI00370CEA32
MKINRHAKIIEIISAKEVETQEDLAEELRKIGIEVTQATVSRDIKELKLIKVLGSKGNYKYAAISPTESFLSDKLISIFSQTVICIENVSNFIVVKTIAGSASAAAEAIDSMNFDGIAGTIAGDNTIFLLIRNEEKAIDIIQKLKRILNE